MQISPDSRPSESANFFSARSSSPNILLLLHSTSSARVRLLAANCYAVCVVHAVRFAVCFFVIGMSWFQRTPQLFVFVLLHLGFWELENEICQGCASWQCETTHSWSFFFFGFLLQMHFTIFSGLFGDFDPLWRTQYMFLQTRRAVSGLYCYEAQPCQMSLSNTQKPRWENRFPCRVNYYLGFSKSPIPCSSTLAGASFNSLVRLVEQNKCHGLFPLLMQSCQHV